MKKLVTLLLVLLMLGGFGAYAAPAVAEASGQMDYVVGFANICESIDVIIELGDFLVSEFARYGMKVIRVDNNFDGATAIRNVDDLLTMGIDALVEFNVDISVAPAIMEKCNEAGIPVIAIDIRHPGAYFFGADNQYAGELAGEYLGQMALERWDGQIDGMLLVDQIASGEEGRRRIFGAVPGIQRVIPDFDDGQVYIIEGKQDAATAQTVTADFLMAHPDWKHLLILTLHDTAWLGVKAAVEVAGREDDVMLVCNAESLFVEYVRKNPEEDFCVGAVTFDLARYGKWLAPAMRDILDGKDVPENIHVEHVIVNRGNVDELYPVN